MTLRDPLRRCVTVSTTASGDRQTGADPGGDALRHAASALGVDVRTLRALRERSPYRTVPVSLWLMGEDPIYVSTERQADELRAVDRSYRLVTR